ncbi:hydrogenase [Desulfosarcina sp. OttesenSCG-928-A07]|nr:hydrogenase [Desulfosarcina sp. OttesenSCG-928-A07]
MAFPLLSVWIMVSGGFLALLLHGRFSLMKWVAMLSMITGCGLGMTDALSRALSDIPFFLSINGPSPFTLEFSIDGLSAFFLVVIFGICFLAAIYSFQYQRESAGRLKTATSYFFFSLLTAAMVMVVTAANMLTFLLAWEIMSLSSFFLVIQDYQSEKNRKAGYLYFVFSHVGAMFIMAAFGLMYHYTGSTAFEAGGLTPWAKGLIFVMAFVGFGSKAGVFPFHVWLPHAHPAAPSHISAVMSGVMIKTGIYGMLRLYQVLDPRLPGLAVMVMIVGVISGVLGVVYALGQNDLKRLLAYSSIENIGIILIGIGIGMMGVETENPVMTIMGFAGGLLHVLNHALFKSLLFMGAGMILHKTGIHTLDALGGVMKKMPITGITFLVGALAISGLPPLNGFVGEFFIYRGGFLGIGDDLWVFSCSLVAIVGLALIGGLALACFTRVVGVVLLGEPRTPSFAAANESGMAMRIPMVILAAGCMLMGIFPGLFIDMAHLAVSAMGYDNLSGLPEKPACLWSLDLTRASLFFIAAVLAVLAIRKIICHAKKPVRRSCTWGCGFTRPTPRMQYTGTSYAASILDFFRPVAPLSEKETPVSGLFPKPASYHSHVWDIVEIGLYMWVVKPVMVVFDKLRWIQHGDIHLYIGYILLAIVVLLFFV